MDGAFLAASPRNRRVFALWAVLVLGASCQVARSPKGDTGVDPSAPSVLLDDASASDFYARPYPRDDRKSGDGTIDFNGYPRDTLLFRAYLAAFAADHHGFGTNSAVYFRLTNAIDVSTLPPSPAAAIDPVASVYLVDLDRGRRVPVRVRFRAEAGRFAGPNLLAVLPLAGFPLYPRTRYAAVVTRRVHGTNGAPVQPPPGIDRLSTSLYAPLAAWARIAGAGVLGDIVFATVFTTGEFTSEIALLRESVMRDVTAPVPTFAPGAMAETNHVGFAVYEGTYPSPNYQQGAPPYLNAGGAIQWDNHNRPLVVRMETLRFAMSVPTRAMPVDGWPFVIYAHGTGGNYRSFIDDGTAGRLAAAGVVVISTDQVLHGPRDPTGTDPALTFFNFQNLPAARDNVRQGAVDGFQLMHLASGWPKQVPMPPGGPISTFSPSAARVAFMGHSQGSLTGAPFVAYEPFVRGAVFSGAGAVLTLALLHKTQPIDVSQLVSLTLDDGVIDEFHPMLNLVQNYFDVADPVNYAAFFFATPPAGNPPKSIFQTIGLTDHYAPLPALEAFALAARLQPVGNLPQPIDGLSLRDIAPLVGGFPVKDNAAGGAATGVVVEYVAPAGVDGHFVAFQMQDAERQLTGFLQTQTASDDGSATLPP
jgi:hypothetical protein